MFFIARAAAPILPGVLGVDQNDTNIAQMRRQWIGDRALGHRVFAVFFARVHSLADAKNSFGFRLTLTEAVSRMPPLSEGFSQHLPHRGIAQSGSAPALGAGCREFESLYPDQLPATFPLLLRP
jgi:hypothetical protein